MLQHDTMPSADRQRSYTGGYMEAGKHAEKIVLAWLRTLSNVAFVDDVRANAEYQSREIDFKIHKQDGGPPINCEVKSDGHLGVTGNWLFELYRINIIAPVDKHFVPGWSARSEADLLLVYAPATDKIHSIPFREYRAAFLSAVARGECKFGIVPTDRVKRTINAYFPEGYVESNPRYKRYDAPPEIELPDKDAPPCVPISPEDVLNLTPQQFRAKYALILNGAEP